MAGPREPLSLILTCNAHTVQIVFLLQPRAINGKLESDLLPKFHAFARRKLKRLKVHVALEQLKSALKVDRMAAWRPGLKVLKVFP